MFLCIFLSWFLLYIYICVCVCVCVYVYVYVIFIKQMVLYSSVMQFDVSSLQQYHL